MKTFLVTNLSFFGDILLTGQLLADIKANYPDSRIVFITNKPFVDVAKYMPQVDKAIYFDKKGEHKGLLGVLKFVFEFKKNIPDKIDTAITIYGNDRGIVLSWLLGAKNRITGDKGAFMNLFSTHVLRNGQKMHMADANSEMLTLLTNKESDEEDISYEPGEQAKKYIDDALVNSGYVDKELVGLCTLSKNVKKDWTPDRAAEFIRLVSDSGRKVVFTGTADAKWFVDELKKLGVEEFLDMTGRTSIVELGALIQRCRAFVSVDTGAMHLAYAVKTPTLAMFFVDNLRKWAPKNLKRNSVVLKKEVISAQEAYEELEKLISKTESESLV